MFMQLNGKLFQILILPVVAIVICVGLVLMGTSFHVYKIKSDSEVLHIADVPVNDWKKMSKTVIFFGHRSVGSNIIDGIFDLINSYDYIDLHVYDNSIADRIDSAMLVHAPVGRNLNPEYKIKEFKEIMEERFGDKVDIAFFKFCFVDITSHSNPEKILSTYCKTMNALKKRFPGVIFMHTTVPLCTPPRTMWAIIKVYIKRALGYSTMMDDNRMRDRYNALLREKFDGKEPLFDLAEYEALGPDGMQYYCHWKGHEVPILINSYTNDGGHLNEVGRRHVAEQLLIKMLELVCSR
jgi:hypothetical protein